MSDAKITALAPWKGSNRMLAHEVGKALSGCSWVGIPFAGGMSELLHVKASTVLVNDAHRDVINLAQIVANEAACDWLIQEASAAPFHPDVLATAQERCLGSPCPIGGDAKRALYYFITCWMGRSGIAGTDAEFKGNLPIRWSATGGDSNTRYRSAVESLRAWRKILQRCNFSCLDCFEFLAKCQDKPGHAIYADPPWPEDGDDYRHKFTEAHQRRLAAVLTEFQEARVVVRYGDHALIRELYPEALWTWDLLTGRTQSNGEKNEVLLTRRRLSEVQPKLVME